MPLLLPVVIDAHKEDVAGVFGNLGGIFLALYLVDGSFGCVVELQLYYKGWFVYAAARNHHKVGKSLTSGVFAMDDILVSCPYIGYSEHAGQGVLIVV